MLIKLLIGLGAISCIVSIFSLDILYSIYGLQCIVLAKIFDMDKDLK